MLVHRGRGATAIRALGFWLCGLALCAAGACDQSDAPARPAEPAAPIAPAASVKATADPVAPPDRAASAQAPVPAPAATPELAAETPTDTAQPSAATSEAAHAGPKRKHPGRRVREIHPQRGRDGCLEMYGSCTPGPDRVCTSEAYYLDCGERGQLPVTGEPLRCVCP
jgi:hypothetical protein